MDNDAKQSKDPLGTKRSLSKDETRLQEHPHDTFVGIGELAFRQVMNTYSKFITDDAGQSSEKVEVK